VEEGRLRVKDRPLTARVTRGQTAGDGRTTTIESGWNAALTARFFLDSPLLPAYQERERERERERKKGKSDRETDTHQPPRPVGTLQSFMAAARGGGKQAV